MASLTAAFGTLYRDQKDLTRWAILYALLLVPTLAALVLDPRLLNGTSVWLKPGKFMLSACVHFLTLVWLSRLVQSGWQGTYLGRLVIWGSIAPMAFEIGYIVFRAALGQASHFNFSPTGLVMYQLMGLGAWTLMAAVAALGILLIRSPHPEAPRPALWAARLGVLISATLGTAVATYLGGQGGPIVGGGYESLLPGFGWSRSHGDLRVPHFFGLHALQALPLLGIGLGVILPRHPRWQIAGLVLGALAYAGLIVALFQQAVAGRPFLPI